MFHGRPRNSGLQAPPLGREAPVEYRFALSLPPSNPRGARAPTASGVSRTTMRSKCARASQTYPECRQDDKWHAWSSTALRDQRQLLGSKLDQPHATAQLDPRGIPGEHDSGIGVLTGRQHECVWQPERRVLSAERGRVSCDVCRQGSDAHPETTDELLERAHRGVAVPDRSYANFSAHACP